ncbi:hypothetical protein THOM_2328 [Trachipleistophora hominis]|uniref:Uncharacterized protein n=1 Tax=Trachipleistophora hominis TaxID=72359 RepID=L7JTU8_TRAHO|nr:hypothetical protein THOM_2328 [Trachipleistophora hominis]
MIIAPVLSIVYYGQLYYSKANTLFVDGKECQRSSFIIHRIICHNRYIILCGITELEILYVLRCKMLDGWKCRKGACGKYIAKKERDKYQSWFLLKHRVPKHRWIVRPKAIKNTSGVHTSALLGEISVNGRILDALIAFNSLYILSDRFLYKNQRKIFIFSECITAGKLIKKVFNTQDMPDCMTYYENQSKQRTLPVTAIIGTVDGRVVTNGFDRKLFDGIVTHISCFKNYVLACSEDRTIVLIKNWTDVDILHVELRGSVYQCGLRGLNNYFAFTECGNVFFNGEKFTFPYKSVCSATFYKGTVLVGLKNGGIMMCKKREFECLNTNRTFSSGQDFFLLDEKQHIVRNNVILYDLSGVKEKIVDFYLKPRIMALRLKDKVWLLWSVPKESVRDKNRLV